MSLTNIPAYVLSIHVKFNHYKKSGSSGVKGRVRSNSINIENIKLVGSVQRGSNPDQNAKFNQYMKKYSSGVKGRVRSNSINIENIKLVGSVQRGSNPDQNAKFNQYMKKYSSGVKGRVRSNSIYIENLKLVAVCREDQTQTKMSNSINIGKQILCRGQRSDQVRFNLYRKSKVGGECAERLKPRTKCQIQSI